MRTATARSSGAAAVLAAVLLVAAGCGGGDEDTGSAADSPTSSASESSSPPADSDQPADSDEPASESSAAGADGDLDQETLIPAITAAMTEAGSVRIDAAVDAGGQSLTITGSQQIGESAADSAVDVTLAGGGLDGRVILVDSILYLDLGQATGGKYVRVDLEAGGPGTEMFAQLLQSTDTAAAVEALQGAVEKLEVVGEEQVDGVLTTHYELSVDARKALEAQQLPPEQLGALPKTLIYDMWVDEDDLLRKMTIDIAGASTTFTLTEWGEPVEISAPPKSQVSKQSPFTAPS